jgi:diketogulonate reductase-like aldo/keto reductase
LGPKGSPDDAESIATIYLALDRGVTMLAPGDNIVPIPGAKRRKYLEENLGALDVKLETDDLTQIGGLASAVKGERYVAWIAQFSEKKT